MRSTPIRLSDTEVDKIRKIKEHLNKTTKKKITHGEVVDILCDIGKRFIKDGHDLAKIHSLCKYSENYSIDNKGINQADMGPMF